LTEICFYTVLKVAVTEGIQINCI